MPTKLKAFHDKKNFFYLKTTNWKIVFRLERGKLSRKNSKDNINSSIRLLGEKPWFKP